MLLRESPSCLFPQRDLPRSCVRALLCVLCVCVWQHVSGRYSSAQMKITGRLTWNRTVRQLIDCTATSGNVCPEVAKPKLAPGSLELASSVLPAARSFSRDSSLARIIYTAILSSFTHKTSAQQQAAASRPPARRRAPLEAAAAPPTTRTTISSSTARRV